MPGKLYKSIASLGNGNHYDQSFLIRKVDEIVARIHMKRYRFTWMLLPAKPKKSDVRLMVMLKDRKGHDHWYAAQDQDQFPGSTVFVGIEDFRESCWEKLLNQKFQKKILKLTPGDDPQVTGFLYTSFVHLLQEKIYELTPGLETRLKQINRILKTECHEEERNKGIWKLNNWHGDPEANPALLEDLRFVGRGISPPEMLRSNNPDSDWAAIWDDEMREYLASLLAAVGGMTRRTTLIEYLKEVYGLDPIRRLCPTSDPDGEDEPDPIDKIKSPKMVLLGHEHIKTAETIIGGMTPRQRLVYYQHIVLENTLAESADIIGGMGTTTAHNDMKDVKKHLEKVLLQYVYGDPEEKVAVMDLGVKKQNQQAN